MELRRGSCSVGTNFKSLFISFTEECFKFVEFFETLHFVYFSSYKLVKVLSVFVSLDVRQGGTNRNRCTQRLAILRAQT